MNAVVNVAIVVPMTFRDGDGNGATGLTVTAIARLSGSPTTTSGTVTERTGGDYDATLTFPSVGVWQVKGSTTVDGIPVVWPETVQVTLAAADSAALATAIAAVQATATAINDNVDVAVSSRASAAVWTSARASKIDQIGSAAAIIAAGSLQDGGRLELRRGDSYLAADGNAKTWSYTGPAIASATLTLRTFAGATVLQVPVTLAGETLSADLTIPQTMALALGTPIYRYEIEATLSAGGTSTLASGDVWTAD